MISLEKICGLPLLQLNSNLRIFFLFRSSVHFNLFPASAASIYSNQCPNFRLWFRMLPYASTHYIVEAYGSNGTPDGRMCAFSILNSLESEF